MSLKARRILFIFFVLLFIVMVPIVLLYATGHTINWRKLSLEKTGSILIESEPAGAYIFVNREPVKQNLINFLREETTMQTPSRIKDLAPGEYTIRLEAYGYWPWEEKVILAPGEALNLGIIHLYNQSKATLIQSAEKSLAKSSPNGSALAMVDGNKLFIINTETDKKDVFDLNKTINSQTKIQWSLDSQRLVIDNLIIDRNKKSVEKINQAKAEKPRWDRNNSSLLYFISNNKLFVKEIENNKESQTNIVLPKANLNITDFDIYGNQIYLLAKDNSGKSFLILGIIGTDLKTISLNNESYSFIEENFPKPLLLAGKKLYILDQPLPILDKQKIIEITSRYTIGKSLNSSIIYATPLELRRWDNENQEYLINRFSAPITALWPLTKTNAIVAGVDNNLKLYILGEKPTTLNLVNKASVQEIAIGQEEKNIYFVGSYKEKSGLFKLPLNEKPDFSNPTLKDISTKK